nr:restriction endonuclease [uncultured Sulfurimonas sp.]
MNNTIYEYKEITNTDLKKYIVNTPLLHKYFKEDWGVLKARQYCGIINYDNQDFYILPKISSSENSNLNIFIYMLRYVYDINLQNEDVASSKNEQHHDFFEIFIQLFALRLFKELQAGIYKEYITEQDNLTTLRGKYLVGENLKYNFTNAKMYCEYDEFSMNNTLNAFFLFAIKTLLPFTKNKKLLKQCELIFDEVEYRHFDIDNVKVHFYRLNARYKDSFEFVILLLKKFIPLFERDKKSFAFLFDMNELFEKFIGQIYKDIDASTKLQNQRNFGNLQLKPDIITSSMIIDTKYKKVKNRDDLNASDKYQMFVYGTNFGVNNTMLLYPKHIQNVNKNLKLGKDDKMIELKMRSVDLNVDGCSYDEYVKEMKFRIGVM